MNNKKQSSIDYAVEKLEKLIPLGNQIIIHLILEQAKAMHKEEIINATCLNDYVNQDDREIGERYYKETFNSDEA